jgi:hypothetical protein
MLRANGFTACHARLRVAGKAVSRRQNGVLEPKSKSGWETQT